MNIMIVAQYVFDILGNGMTDTFEVPINRLKTPAPFVEGQLPIGVMANKPPGTTVTLTDGILKIVFDIPPSAARVIVDGLFGKKG